MNSDAPPATRIALAQALAADDLARTAALDVPVLVSAATLSDRGTCARLLHAGSGRSEQPFIELHCGGHDGSVTPPAPVTNGELTTAFLRARGGTLYLDDVAALDSRGQTWLSSQLTIEMITRRVRLISGSDGSLAERVAAGRFEPDLFYRLNVIHINRT